MCGRFQLPRHVGSRRIASPVDMNTVPVLFCLGVRHVCLWQVRDQPDLLRVELERSVFVNMALSGRVWCV